MFALSVFKWSCSSSRSVLCFHTAHLGGCSLCLGGLHTLQVAVQTGTANGNEGANNGLGGKLVSCQSLRSHTPFVSVRMRISYGTASSVHTKYVSVCAFANRSWRHH